jgi:methylated-DNA-[protein]-cysteine S-methyltransferase
MTYYTTVPSPIGRLFLFSDGQHLTGLKMGPTERVAGARRDPAPFEIISDQLDRYWNKELREFEVPIATEGTEFQKKVWEGLRTIPYGETISYKELAHRIGLPRAIRAVGQANNRNPIAIVVPCHRVIGANGSLTGYGGGLDKKERLLALEARVLASELG